MNNKNDIAQLRRSYLLKKLDEGSALNDPLDQFGLWFEEAINSKTLEPNAMALATANKSGIPSVRIVLLRKFNERGFVFFTNYFSAKANDINENPNAALLFYWPELERQVRINGKVEKVTKEESENYFNTRPRGHRIGAWASEQSRVIENRLILEKRFKEIEEKYKDDNIPLPPFWGGYRLIPNAYEFWQGRESRLHDRLRYTLQEGIWKIERLSP